MPKKQGDALLFLADDEYSAVREQIQRIANQRMQQGENVCLKWRALDIKRGVQSGIFTGKNICFFFEYFGKVVVVSEAERIAASATVHPERRREAAFPMTFSNCKTEDGKITVYFSEGEFTDDNIEKEFFGCGGVARIEGLQDKLIRLARGGFRHHTTVGNGHVKAILEEAFRYYLGYDVVSIEGNQ